MFEALNIFKKKSPKTYKIRFYNKHTDDEEYFLMGNHEVDKEILDILMNSDNIINRGRFSYNIDKRTTEFHTDSGKREIIYVFSTSTTWKQTVRKPDCYTKHLFLPEAFDLSDFPG